MKRVTAVLALALSGRAGTVCSSDPLYPADWPARGAAGQASSDAPTPGVASIGTIA